MSSIDSIGQIGFAAAAGAARVEKPSLIGREVMELFEEFRHPLLRYCLALGISVHDGEEVIQEVFLCLFRHLEQDKSRRNLRGWLFRVAHNLALKQRMADKKTRDRTETCESIAERCSSDPAAGPEEHLSAAQRRDRLLAVVEALPVTDKSCLSLRAEGLRYREIAQVLGISLGSVSISLARSLARLSRADGR